jgi:hypothetical protein
VERSTWTDERINDFTQRVDADIREFRVEVRAGFAEIRGELAALRLMVMRFGGGLLIAQFGMIAALIARG